MEHDHIYNMDCLEGMKQIPDGTIDLISTDEYKKGYEQGQLDLLEKLMYTKWTDVYNMIGEQYKRLTHDRLSERTTQ